MSMDDFGYSQCDRCHGEHLTFNLYEGLCFWCRGVLLLERLDEPTEREEKK